MSRAATREIIEFDSAAWGRSNVSPEDLEVLSDFTGLTEEECLARLETYRIEEMAAAWRDRNPQSPKDILRFYAETDHYLWELLSWHGSAGYEAYWQRLDRLRELWPPPTHPLALDYGAGVGSAAKRLAEIGYSVTLADVPGRTFEFAQLRLRRHGIPFDVIDISADPPELPRRRWDVLVCFDVLEHLQRPAGAARALIAGLKDGGGAAIVAPFDLTDDRFPHHLEQGATRFGQHRWGHYLQGRGLKHLGDCVYEKLGARGRLARRLQYLVWRATGLRVERSPR